MTTREIHEAWDRELAAVPGVVDLVERLREHGVPTCVASSGTHERMRRTLGLTGLDENFAGRIYSATEVPRGKPAPDLFLHAARSMGVEPSRCAVVEDSAYGVRAAVAAGMTAYGFTGGLVDAEALAEAGAVLFDQDGRPQRRTPAAERLSARLVARLGDPHLDGRADLDRPADAAQAVVGLVDGSLEHASGGVPGLSVREQRCRR